MSEALLRLEQLSVQFAVRGRVLRAVDGVDLAIRRGEMLGLVGESGCGKSTLGKTIIGLIRATGGRILFDGDAVEGLGRAGWRRVRRRLQYVYQDPGASLDPRWSIGRSLEEPLAIHTRLDARDRRARVLATLAEVGLREDHAGLYPHELSGGQQRRVGLARILTLQPECVVLDEPTSGLDVSVQATILKLLRDLRAAHNLTMLFISHDLSVVRMMCDSVAVMYLGRIVEIAPVRELFSAPRHPYTRALLDAVPEPGERRVIGRPLLEGDPPDPSDLPSGCRFRSRCPVAVARCATDDPALHAVGPHHEAACHLATAEGTPG
jgi:oligopeptide/dipeptide ABC transporter ATP-binding protein